MGLFFFGTLINTRETKIDELKILLQLNGINQTVLNLIIMVHVKDMVINKKM